MAPRLPASSPSARVRHARRLFAGIAPGYDLMGEVLSWGQNLRWRRFLVSRVPPGGQVLDVATGTAAVALGLAGRGDAVTALDQSEPMLRAGLRRVREEAASVRLLLGQAERLPFEDATFDALTFTYLLRYVDDVPATLAELVRVVRPGGVIASLEFGVPRHPVARAGWDVQTAVALPLLGRMASRSWAEAGRFLRGSIREHRRRWPPAREAEAWRAAGIEEVRVRELSFGAGVVVWGRRAG